MNVLARSLCLARFAAFLIGIGAGAAAAVADPIPADLARVESAAEAGFEAALAADRVGVAAAGVAVRKGWSRYRARALRDAVPLQAVRAVNAALRDTRRRIDEGAAPAALARDFNAISAPLARIYAVYKPAVPAALLDLDSLGRALMVDARLADLAQAAADVEQLARRWAAFRPRVLAVAAAAVRSAVPMDEALAQARAAIEARDTAALERAALAETELVDVIEKLFAGRAVRGAD